MDRNFPDKITRLYDERRGLANVSFEVRKDGSGIEIISITVDGSKYYIEKRTARWPFDDDPTSVIDDYRMRDESGQAFYARLCVHKIGGQWQILLRGNVQREGQVVQK